MDKTSLSKIVNPKSQKVYKSKKLNTANFCDFNHTDYQVFLHLVSKIGRIDKHGKYLQPDELQREHVLSAKQFSEIFNVSLSNCYGILKQAVDKLMKADVRIERHDDSGICRINVCSMAEYKSKEGNIVIKFTDDIMPYLAQVKQKFVLYNLKEISNFGSLYTTRLYELLQEFKETGLVFKSVKQLREAFAVGQKFKTYNNFKAKTFAHACQEINANYNIDLRFEEIKEGRKVVAVKFFFKKPVISQITNQQTGEVSNVWAKSKALLKSKPQVRKTKVKQILQKAPDILKDQFSFVDSTTDPKPIGNIMTSILSRFRNFKK